MNRALRLLGSELRLMLGRRRNQIGMLVLAAMPIIIAVATYHEGGPRSRGADFTSQITDNGVFAAFTALTVEMTIFLPMAVALTSGDAIAGEANQGTLRYLLTVPVSRVRLLAVKYVSLVLGALLVTTIVAVTGVVVGVALFGTGPLLTLSGTRIPLADGLWRLVLCVLYVSAGLAALAAIGLFVSTLTEQPIASTVVVMLFTAGSWILDQIPQLDWLHPYLLVDRWPAMVDFMRDPPLWSTIQTGLLVDLAYAVVFLPAAWASLSSKDITS